MPKMKGLCVILCNTVFKSPQRKSKFTFFYYWPAMIQKQFPCILPVASVKGLLSSCCLYNVHEKTLTEGECELN